MSYDYAMSRVRDALEKCEGNHLKAHRMIVEWLGKDNSMLSGLTAQHLPGIIAHALKQAEEGPKKAMPRHVELDEPSAPGKASQKHIDAINILVSKGAKKAD